MEFEEQLQAVAEVLNCNFTLKGEAIAMEKVFAKSGLLPAIMRRADQLSSFCMGYGLGVTFEKEEGGILGVTVNFNDSVPNSLRLLCATDVLIEIVQGSSSTDNVVLDELMLE